MKKIIVILCVSFLFSCSEKNASPNSERTGPGEIVLSLSSAGVNFLDFPFTVKSIMLSHESGKNIELTDGFSVNLVNFGERPQYILTKSDMPVGAYSRIVLNLEFTEKNTVTYFDSSQTDKPVTTYLISQTGKKLGVDHKNFMINMPFFGKHLSVKAGSATHLNIAWNLNASTEIMAPADGSAEDWLVEFKPLVQARGIDQTTEMMVQGQFMSVSDEGIEIQSAFDSTESGHVTLKHKNISRLTLNGEATDLANVASSANAETYVSVVSDMHITQGQPSFLAKVINYFDKTKTLLRGLVFAKTEETIDVLGSKISSSDAITQPKKTYKLPAATVSGKERVYDVFSRISLRMDSSEFDALSVEVDVNPEGTLKGPSDVVVLGEKTEVVEEEKPDGSPLKEDVFYLTVTEENEAASSENARQVKLLSNNGITVDQDVITQLASNIEVKWVVGALWRAEGYFKMSGSESILVVSNISTASTDQSKTYKYDFKYEDNSVFDFADNGSHPTVEHDSKKTEVKAETEADSTAKEAKPTVNVSSKLVFSEPMTLTGSAGSIICKSIPTGLPETGDEYQEGSATIVFELMQNNDAWEASTKSELLNDYINSEDFEGDFSTADLIYTNPSMKTWFDDIEDVPGKRLLIHSMMLVTEPMEDEGDLTSGGHCNIKPTYISIRWIREGTLLDAYKEAWARNMRRDIGIGIGIGAAALAGGAILGGIGYLIQKAIKNKWRNFLTSNEIGYGFDYTLSSEKNRVSLTADELQILKDGKVESEEYKKVLAKSEKSTKKSQFITFAEFKELNNQDFNDDAIKKKFGSNLSEAELSAIKSKLNVNTSTDMPEMFKLRVKGR